MMLTGHAPTVTALLRRCMMIAAAVVACFGSSDLMAGCGSYVLVDGKVLHDVKHPAAPLSEFNTRPVNAPCHGPNCSQDQDQVPSMPPSTVPSSQRVDAVMPTHRPVRDSDGTARSHTQYQLSVPEVFLSGLFRPPRAIVG